MSQVLPFPGPSKLVAFTVASQIMAARHPGQRIRGPRFKPRTPLPINPIPEWIDAAAAARLSALYGKNLLGEDEVKELADLVGKIASVTLFKTFVTKFAAAADARAVLIERTTLERVIWAVLVTHFQPWTLRQTNPRRDIGPSKQRFKTGGRAKIKRRRT